MTSTAQLPDAAQGDPPVRAVSAAGTGAPEPPPGEPAARLPEPAPRVAPVPAAAIGELRRTLGVSHVTAQALARRGLAEPQAARRWLAGNPGTQAPLPGVDAAAALVLRHIEAGHTIVVHGDYDVDGVCASAILLDVLELLGADARWHLPKRGVDGYGLTDRSLVRIGRLGAGLVITVDCGITAVEETAKLVAGGVDVLITDHHLPRADGALPDAAILHPAVRDGAIGEADGAPCGAGVAAGLAFALLERTGQASAALHDGILELAALATIADCVPLTDGNRALVREGLGALGRTRRPGLRALLRSARVDLGAIDGQAVAFRLGPRLNAAGRMARADLALALIRARTPEQAARLSEELERCNLQRREAEKIARGKAEQQIRAAGRRSGYVVAGEGWPAGVIGIVAARLAEQTDCPVVVVSLDGEHGTGSARSARGVDLAAIMGECAGLLERHGGHAAAAGCELRADRLEAFADAFDAAAARALEHAPEATGPEVDAVAEVADLSLELADELAAFEPTGEGNPAVRLLLPAVRIIEEQPMGGGAEHRRAVIAGGGARSRAVAFSSPPLPTGVPVDLVVHLERSAFGGTVEARVVVHSAHPREPAGPPAVKLGVGIDAGALTALIGGYEHELPEPLAPGRPTVDRRGASVAASLRVAAACGREVVAYAAEPGRRRHQLAALGAAVKVVGPAELSDALALAGPETLLVCVDPPIDPRAAAALVSAAVEHWWTFSEAELTFSVHVLEREFALRPAMVALFRALRAHDGPMPHAGLLAVAREHGSPAAVGRALRVLDELGLVAVDDGLSAVRLVGTESPEADASPVFRRAAAIVEGARSWNPVTSLPR